MEDTSPFVNGRRISGTLKLQSSAPRTETAPRSQAPPMTVRRPDKWEVVEASWAAMTKRTRGGCAPRAVSPPPHSVLPHGRQRAETPTGLPSDLVAPNT